MSDIWVTALNAKSFLSFIVWIVESKSLLCCKSLTNNCLLQVSYTFSSAVINSWFAGNLILLPAKSDIVLVIFFYMTDCKSCRSSNLQCRRWESKTISGVLKTYWSRWSDRCCTVYNPNPTKESNCIFLKNVFKKCKVLGWVPLKTPPDP